MTAIPNHLAIILDGNARWAKARNKRVSYGHAKGVAQVEEIVDFCQQTGIKIVTLYAFSSENWKRPTHEINVLFRLMHSFFKSKIKKIIEKKVRVIILGDATPLPKDIKELIVNTEEISKNGDRLILQIAINYGGRDEIIRATKKCMVDYQQNRLSLNELNEESFKLYLDTAHSPDLLIRTGGNQRISNFLLYQMAYTEFYFTSTLWPDLHTQELNHIIQSFQNTERRFGGRNNANTYLPPNIIAQPQPQKIVQHHYQ